MKSIKSGHTNSDTIPDFNIRKAEISKVKIKNPNVKLIITLDIPDILDSVWHTILSNLGKLYPKSLNKLFAEIIITQKINSKLMTSMPKKPVNTSGSQS